MEAAENRTKILDITREYRQKNFGIIPLVVKGKRPSIASWEVYQRVRAEKEEIERWFSNGGENSSNIAIVTGKISSIIAFDIDGDNAKKYFEDRVGNIEDE